MTAQSLDVKRAQVEFHNFASLGEPERASRMYREENIRRADVLRSLGVRAADLTPFAEIGANAAHTSLLLMNEFGGQGFALDISADSLRYGYALMNGWGVERGPVRVAGDALRLPFADGSLGAVLAFQMLSQFLDIEPVFREVKRVLRPGGIFVFAEEPMRRLATLRLWRTPYYEQMKPIERRLYDWGLLPFLVQDVIGAGQEESFGIRQNHRMTLTDWAALTRKHFATCDYRLFVPERGPFERAAKQLAIRLDPYQSQWRAAKLLGGTMAALCRKEGEPQALGFDPSRFETSLRCPDCGATVERDSEESIVCAACGYRAPFADGVYNLLPSADRAELYPGDRADTIDMSHPAHADRLVEGWYSLEGVYGNRYRWVGAAASARLENVRGGRQRLRIRGYRPERDRDTVLTLRVNGFPPREFTIGRPGLFVIETELDAAPSYEIRFELRPTHRAEGDSRELSVNFSLIRLLPIQ
jgi:SAM-dependent methyltransferase